MSHKVSTLLAAGEVRLLVIDSVAGLFRGADDDVTKSSAAAADYFMRRAKKLGALGSLLHRLSARHAAVVIAVNQVLSSVNEACCIVIYFATFAIATHISVWYCV